MSAEADAKAAGVLEQLQRIGAKVFFEKQLTSSDSASGRVVVPKVVAEQYFPKLDNSSTGMPLDVEDTQGKTHTLRWRFWANNQSRMYLLEQTADLQSVYAMKMGDVLTFAQKDDKTVVLAGRPATRADAARKQARKQSPTPPAGAKSSGKAGAKEPTPKAVKDRSQRAALRRYGLAPEDVEAPTDGVFRAAAGGEFTPELDVYEVRKDRWAASLDLSGELYQAFFETEAEAREARALAGFAQLAVSAA